jgi:hypothetical protein
VAVVKADEGNYRCLVSNMAGSVTSLAAVLTVNKTNQAALVFNPASPQVYNTTNLLGVAGGSGTGAVSYQVLSGPGQIVGSNGLWVTTGTGVVSVTATKAADQNYNVATVTAQVAAARADQAIAFPAIPDQAGTNVVRLSATASSGLAVSFAVASGPGQIAGSDLSFTGTGLVTIVASQAGDGNWNPAANVTNFFRVTAVAISLSPPTGVSASDGEFTDKVRLTWYSVALATTYEVWRHTTNNSGAAVKIAETSNTVYEDTSAGANVVYFYWIRAKANSIYSGISEFSNSEMGYRTPSAATLNPPDNVLASDGTYTNKVRVSYGAVAGAGTYEIWRSPVSLLSAAALLGETTSLNYDDLGVTPNVTYYYWVRAKNPVAVSGFSLPNSGYAALGGATSGNADLALLSLLYLPGNASVGDHPGAVSVQLINLGPADLGGGNTRIELAFYLSANTNFGDADDVWFGDYGCDQTLTAGSYTTLILPAAGREGLTIPAGLTGGTYNVFARVRPAPPSTLNDPDLSNNWTMRPGAIVVAAASAGYHLLNDYDGDGKSDLAVYRAADGKWEVMLSGSGYQTATLTFGGVGCQPALADYDGDGKSDPAIYEEASGNWQVLLSARGYALTSAVLGGNGYAPAPADFDGDGLADPAVYQEASGQWQVLLSGSGYALASPVLGGNGYKAAPADYDGDGKADLAVYRKSTGEWQFMLSTLDYWTVTAQFGGAGQVPVPADFDGDGKCDPAVYKENSGAWSVMMSLYNYLVAHATHGGQGYVAVPADYDGDGKGDVVVYGERAGELKILLSGSGYRETIVNLGGPGYAPVGAAR